MATQNGKYLWFRYLASATWYSLPTTHLKSTIGRFLAVSRPLSLSLVFFFLVALSICQSLGERFACIVQESVFPVWGKFIHICEVGIYKCMSICESVCVCVCICVYYIYIHVELNSSYSPQAHFFFPMFTSPLFTVLFGVVGEGTLSTRQCVCFISPQ